MEVKVISVIEKKARVGPAGKRSISKLIFGEDEGAKNFSMLYVEFPIGGRSDEHVRENEEAIYVLSGELLLECAKNEGKVQHRVKAGEAIYLPPGLKHQHINIGNEALRKLVIFAPPGAVTERAKKTPYVDLSKLEG